MYLYVQQSRGEINIKEFARFLIENKQTEKIRRMHHKRINYGDLLNQMNSIAKA